MRRALLLLALAPLACGGKDTSSPVVELRATGVSPTTIPVASKGTLRFVNKDTADHQITSADCSELATPQLAANAESTVTLGVGPKTCTYSDALNPANTAFQGKVTVLAPGVGPDPGY